MTKVSWGDTSQRAIEYGVDRGLLQIDGVTVAWPGLITVSEQADGAENRALYVDGLKFTEIAVEDDYAATIDAYGAPSLFRKAEGITSLAPGLLVGQQKRKPFSFSYRNLIGNADNPEIGYKLHVVHNALTLPSEREFTTVSDETEPIVFSWEITTVPVNDTMGFRPTSRMTIDSTEADQAALASLELIMYGGPTTEPRIPTQQEIINIFSV